MSYSATTTAAKLEVTGLSETFTFPYSVAFWTKSASVTGSTTNHYVMFLGLGASRVIGIRAYDNDGQGFLNTFDVNQTDGTNNRISTSGADNAFETSWTHWVFTWSSASALPAIYINNSSVAASIQVATPNFSGAAIASFTFRGPIDSSGSPKGLIAEIGTWNNYTLNSTDRTNLYTNKYAPSLVANSSLTHYWDLRNSGGNGLNDGKGSVNLGNTSYSADADHPASMVYSLGGSSIPVFTKSYAQRRRS